MRRILLATAAALVVGAGAVVVHGLYQTLREARVASFDAAPPSQALASYEGPPPETAFLDTADGLRLRYAVFAPAGQPRDTILLIPGKGDSVEDYLPLIADYARLGYLTFCLDPRSQGLSSRTLANPQKVHVESFDAYVADMALMLERVVKPRQMGALVLVAHSMGAATSLLGLADKAFAVDRLALLTPMLEAKPLPHDGLWADFVRAVAVGYRLTLHDGAYFVSAGDWRLGADQRPWSSYTTYQPGYQHWIDDWTREPRLITGGVTAGWVNAYYRATDRLRALPDHALATPTTMWLAGEDELIVNAEAQSFCKAKMAHCAFEVLDGEKHNIQMTSPQILQRIAERTGEGLAATH